MWRVDSHIQNTHFIAIWRHRPKSVSQRESFYTYYNFQLLCSYCKLTDYYVSLVVILKHMLAWQFPFFLLLLINNISTLEHALLSYLQYKVQNHVYFSITPFRMKYLFTLSVPKIIFWHCAPWKAVMPAFILVFLFLFFSRYCLKYQNPCYVLSDKCQDGSNLN